MGKFKRAEIDILVATSVIEVGVDVPNATIMMIEGSERFGLAQLYQFRGRVGRGEHQSYCFLLTDSNSPATHARLKAVITAKNGFELAEEDLKLRGPGQFFGDVQTGFPDAAMSALQDAQLVKSSREAATALLAKDPTLASYQALRKRFEEFKKNIHRE
jgi:ATP-dependent DNA helicase RecG